MPWMEHSNPGSMNLLMILGGVSFWRGSFACTFEGNTPSSSGPMQRQATGLPIRGNVVPGLSLDNMSYLVIYQCCCPCGILPQLICSTLERDMTCEVKLVHCTCAPGATSLREGASEQPPEAGIRIETSHPLAFADIQPLVCYQWL